MKITPTFLPECWLLEPKVFGDTRGFFMESFRQSHFAERGLNFSFVQDNVSFSSQGVLRGLHLQSPFPQGKLVSVLSGQIFDVAVDVRPDSPSFGKWVGEILSSENHRQLWIPPGFAHGFAVMSPTALVQYKCTEYYHPEAELTLAWNDPDLAIDWPIASPQVSEKDTKGISLRDFRTTLLTQRNPSR